MLLFLFTTSELPTPDSGDAEEFLMLDIGFEDVPEGDGIPLDELEFASTLVTTLSPAELDPEEVGSWWEALTGATASVELLADDPSRIGQSELDRSSRLGDARWAVNSNFVAYKRGSREAREEAVAFIRECVLESS
jgi:hypothetical protein